MNEKIEPVSKSKTRVSKSRTRAANEGSAKPDAEFWVTVDIAPQPDVMVKEHGKKRGFTICWHEKPSMARSFVWHSTGKADIIPDSFLQLLGISPDFHQCLHIKRFGRKLEVVEVEAK